MTVRMNASPSIWHIFGLDETGSGQLRDWHKKALENADLIIADVRFHDMLSDAGAQSLEAWPKPFSDLKSKLDSFKTKSVVLFATGDPLFYGAGASVKRYFPEQEIIIWPALSGIQLACAHRGWQLPDCEVISIHGRAVETVISFIYPFAKWLVIPKNAGSLHEVASCLCNKGCAEAEISALSALGRQGESQLVTKTATQWQQASLEDMSDFYMMAVDLAPCGRVIPHNASGVLPDEAFISDGKLTKQDARASALSKLKPHPHAVLWDLGTGCGSIAIEWARTHLKAKAYGIDSREDRLERARANAMALGTPDVAFHKADILSIMPDLPEPDAIFIGGGLTSEAISSSLSYLPAGGRLVCHAVTLQSEALLLEAHRRHGGDLTRITIHKAEPVGPYHGWRGLMPVTQWAYVKKADEHA